jgi:hypothetical protein
LSKQIILNNIFTEYDDSIHGDGNIDPLGMLVIWSGLGREIFSSRISSIANDLRSYTVNLLHHAVIKSLIEDSSVSLSNKISSIYHDKNDLKFKQSCILMLENIYIFSIIKNSFSDNNVTLQGVIGSSNGRKIWESQSANPKLAFGVDVKESQVLVRQLLLGVNGRYKSPMMFLEFFDSNYNYIQEGHAWEYASEFIDKNRRLRKLKQNLKDFLVENILTIDSENPTIRFSDIPDEIKKSYGINFSTSKHIGSYATDFWLKITKLDQNAPGALRELILTKDDLEYSEIIGKAINKPGLAPKEKTKLENIFSVEPLLSEISQLFTHLLNKKNHTVREVEEIWHNQWNRKVRTLNQYASKIRQHQLTEINKSISATAKYRLEKLLLIGEQTSLENQIKSLIQYHSEIMQQRGNTAWLRFDDGQIKLFVRPRPLSEKVSDSTKKHWVHHYYLPEFKIMLDGMRDK